ncbi:MAG TPA: ROK family transcriptional regulator [Tepiditoga sp.]|nr:ROK family transcriptional regulator [Thermotogota bacterium]HOO75077.1 ROK family transcriptional regulator [Tepiditoga sp.]
MSESYRSTDLKILNKRLILKTIFLKTETTRKELADITKLSNSSVTRIITELIDEGYILKKNKINESRYGRKSEILTVNKEKLKVFIVDIDVKTTLFGFGRFDGTVEILKTIPTPETFYEFKESVDKFIKLFNYNFNYITFSIPGIVDLNNKIIINTPNLNWERIFYEEIGFEKLLIDNDSNLSILAEKTFSEDMEDTKNAAFILIKDGIGTGLLLDGKIYRGVDFGAGEIGHNIIRESKKIKSFESSIDFENNVEKSLEAIALNISYAVNLMNFEKIIIGGKIINLPTENFRFLEKKIREYTFSNNKNLDIRITNFNYVPASMVGACSNAVLNFIDNV